MRSDITQLCRYAICKDYIVIWMTPEGTSDRETERGRRGRQTWQRAVERETEKLTPEGEGETEERERSLFGMSKREEGSFCVYLCVCVCVFSVHAASTIPLKVLFNNVNVPH